MARKKTVDPEKLPYRPCVGIMVLNAEGLVWAGHRIVEAEGEMAGSSQLWQMPQGGIDKGEEPLPAALRELYEETGMRSVSLLAEAPGWIAYDLPPELVGVAFKGKYRGQTQKWFAFRFTGRGERDRHQPAAGRPFGGVRRLGLEEDGRTARPHRAVQAPPLSAGRRDLPGPGGLTSSANQPSTQPFRPARRIGLCTSLAEISWVASSLSRPLSAS